MGSTSTGLPSNDRGMAQAAAVGEGGTHGPGPAGPVAPGGADDTLVDDTVVGVTPVGGTVPPEQAASASRPAPSTATAPAWGIDLDMGTSRVQHTPPGPAACVDVPEQTVPERTRTEVRPAQEAGMRHTPGLA
ncbi:hypothetical protein [Intrasporangium sp.]|uniref:hypothetical protein n=1 Tax=Intrasporangium sp. TaxID=1925024 RepID=UPI0032219F4E